MKFIYKGCDVEEKQVHMILELESMEKRRRMVNQTRYSSKKD
jgi:hypothetical protein